MNNFPETESGDQMSNETDEKLAQIEWMLSGAGKESILSTVTTPDYGDLTSLNTARTILDSVGEATLKDIVMDYLRLLSTSSSVYEKNGDYALGIFSSGWCRYLDSASRKMCTTDDNLEALHCGKWLCHESCWSMASKEAITKNVPVDIECKGGLRLFAIPIHSGGEIIGSINFGYGTPPRSERKIREIATLYNADEQILRNLAQQYDSRPQFIIDIAKERLFASARLIGIMVERKRAESELAARERRFTQLIKNSYDTIVILDSNGILRYVSDTAERVHGYTSAELIDLPVIEQMIHPDDQEQVLATFHQVIATGEGCVQYRHRHKSGGWVYLEARATNQLSNPDIHGIVVNISDITDRKRVEEALRQSEERLELAMEVKNIGVWDWDLVTNTTFFDERYYTMAGYSPYEFSQDFTAWASKVHPYDLPFAQKAIQEYISGVSMVFDIEFRFKRKNGVWMWIQGRGKIVARNESGEPLRMIGTHTDITERRVAEEELRRSQEKYRTIVENITDALYIHDFNGCILDCNEAACRMVGYSRGELIGQSISMIDSEENKRLLPQRMAQLLRDNMIIFEGSHIRKDGSVVIVEACSKVVSRENEGIIHGFGRDITDRKRTEEALANAQKLESLGVLAGGIAHDFNNLMGGIFGFVELANETSNDETVKQSLTKVMMTIDRARDLTQQLLTFAKGGAPLQVVAPLFPHVQQTVQFALSGSNVSCNFEIMDNLWSANYDKNQIGQVIDNLIINAQQAMPLGGTIKLSARNVTLSTGEHPILAQGDFVRISISDSGVGIPKELQKKIFDPFFTTKSKGHGLGLATSYSIIRRHGGCIDVYSDPGKGSTFKVYLPASLRPGTDITTVRPKTHTGRGLFLVMDDEDVMRETISAMLRTFGYSVVCTKDGQEAIDHVVTVLREKQTLTGLLFDLTVPGATGGKEAISQIRKMGVDVPAFVASGYADDPVIKNPREHGFTASICKPFMRSELIEMLEKHINSTTFRTH